MVGAGAPACSNCGSPRASTFCAECGERQPSSVDYSTRHLVTEAFNELANVDGRLWRSVVALLSKPGFLTVEYFAGRRGRYMRPFSLFVLLNVAFFFVQPYTGLLRYTYEMYTSSNDGLARMAQAKRQELGLSPAAFAQRMDDELRDEKKSLLLVAVPVFAAVLLVLYAGSTRVYVEHLVFSVHAYAFILFYFTAFSTLGSAILRLLYHGAPVMLPVIRFLSGEGGVLLALCAGIVPYLAFGLHRFYGSSAPASIARALVLFVVFQGLILVFRNVLFHTALLFA